MRQATALLEPGRALEPGRRPIPSESPSAPARIALVVLPRRDEDAGTFEAFFQAEYPRLLRAMYLVTGDRHEAEEVAQDAFVRACERWDLVSRATNRPGYVYRMALNAYRSKLRRLARGARKALRPQEEPDLFAAVDDRDALGRALARLSKGQREAVVLVEWMGMTDDEAGALLRISPVTVRVRMHRARAVLKPLLERGNDP
jgi:RNA polymerase sigma factor (sigma-70 family)